MWKIRNGEIQKSEFKKKSELRCAVNLKYIPHFKLT
jgi:hypothetical protein